MTAKSKAQLDEEEAASPPTTKKKAADEPAKEPVEHSGKLYSCGLGKIILMADESMETPGASYDLAPKGECTINGKAYPLDDLKRGDKVTLEGEPVTKVTATR